MADEKFERSRRAIIAWLCLVCVLIVSTVVVGGVTRLTESGLSIVEWEPILGVVPPMGDAAWQERFDAYKAFPEYQILRREMTLDEFKSIFLWEYFHRLIARGIGLVFFLPLLFWTIRGAVRGSLAVRLWIAFFLGGAQGALGWFMVRSGLSENPYVSHFRLAAHLSLALFLLSFLIWILAGLVKPAAGGRPALRPGFLYLGILNLGSVALQIIYGAFVAGLNAGYMLNTWPKVMGQWVPDGLWQLKPLVVNLVSNPVNVQFIHRWFAFVVLAVTIWFWIAALRSGAPVRLRIALSQQTSLLVFQIILGIFTLVLGMPVFIAVFHQLVGCLILAAAVWALFEARGRDIG